MKVNKEEISIDEIEINVKNPANNVEISVTKLDEKPASITHEITGKIYQYIEINKKNINDEDINNAVIDFKVEKSWIIQNNADEDGVVLNRYTNSWHELETEKTGSDVEYAYYKAETPSFSYFAIAVKEKIIPEEVAENATPANVTEPLGKINETGEIQEEVPKKSYGLLIIMAAVILAVLISYFNYWRK